MNKFLVALGTILAASSTLIFLAGREAKRRAVKIPAAQAAAQLAEAWSDYHTRA